ncbi:actin-domain-containing protein [Athelia psychrophila]|uniref:Actin-like protein ARP6 n=1 Tax=Athelia psychrophila TaxID=1759441 RepID=A0A167XS28_9AGAM|nr:actin-domain-containing protein [Fibularhizoctonia sp. CBS 109695]
MKPLHTLILDNGAYTIKSGALDAETQQPRIIQNVVVRSKGDKKTYFGHEIDQCQDFSSLHYRMPFEKGYLVDWDAQKAVWDRIFSDEVLQSNTNDTSLLITEPYFNLPNIQDVYDQFVFEEYEFQSYHRTTPAAMIPHGSLFDHPDLPPAECMLVVDSGFSYTHVIPIMNGQVVWSAAKRLDVGGKLLTNQLKELVSFRQWNMMDETHVMNHVKEICCYVSTQFSQDLETCRVDPKGNPIVQEYLLPNYSINRPGRIRTQDDMIAETDQILLMNNERFAVPEVLFRPDDIGLDQSGLAMTIAASVSALPGDLQGMFWANIGLIGGTTKFAGFGERLMQELRPIAPIDCEVVIFQCDDPISEAYQSAVNFARHPQYSEQVVTRTEYLESGSNACRRKFRDWRSSPSDATLTDEQRSQAVPPPKGKGKKKDKEDGGRVETGSGRAVLRGKGRRR